MCMCAGALAIICSRSVPLLKLSCKGTPSIHIPCCNLRDICMHTIILCTLLGICMCMICMCMLYVYV